MMALDLNQNLQHIKQTPSQSSKPLRSNLQKENQSPSNMDHGTQDQTQLVASEKNYQPAKNQNKGIKEFDKSQPQDSNEIIPIDPRLIFDEIDDILPKIPLKMKFQQLIQTHPWSILNPLRPVQKKNTLKTFAIRMIQELNYSIYRFQNTLQPPKEQKKEATIELVKPEGFIHFSDFAEALKMKNPTPFDQLKRRQNFDFNFEIPHESKTVEKIVEGQFNFKPGPQPSREQLDFPQRVLIVEEYFDQKKRNWRKQMKEKWKNEETEERQLQKKYSRPQNTVSKFCNSVGTPQSSNNRTSTKKDSKSTNSTNKADYLPKQTPQVSEFKITDYEKPFTKKYEITIDSYEQAAWKWWLYRMKDGIKSTYNGLVKFERFQSCQISQTAIIKDFLIKNVKVEKICEQSKKFDRKIHFETIKQINGHTGDLKGLIILPLQLKLSEGYKYEYQSYHNGIVYKLWIENEHASIRFFFNINLGKRDEAMRDFRNKLHLNRDRVWIGHELLRQQAIITFKQPTTYRVQIESNHPQQVSFCYANTTKQDMKFIEDYPMKIKVEPCYVMKTIRWKKDPNYRVISVNFKLKVLTVLVGCFLLDLLMKACFPNLK